MTGLAVYQVPRDANADAWTKLAALHAACFPSGWSAQSLSDIVKGEGAACFQAVQAGSAVLPPFGFILVRALAGEAEILTLAVWPHARRKGAGRALLHAAMAFALSCRADTLFLEVAQQNAAAIGLYASAGFQIVGQRPAYYEGPSGSEDAWIMRLSLAPLRESRQGR